MLPMDIPQSDLNTALQEAFTLYLAFLSYSQTLRESNLGKGVETEADLSSEEEYKSRVAITETCLRYTRRISRGVRRWTEDCTGDGDTEEEVVSFENLLPKGQKMSLASIFSGNWIQVQNPGENEVSTMDKPRSRTKPQYEDSRRRRRSYMSPRSSISIHQNIPISQANLYPDISTGNTMTRSAEEDDKISVTSDMATDFYRQRTSDDEYSEHGRREEQIGSRKAQELADRTLAENLQKQEKERLKRIQRDRDAAQQAQEQWEVAAMARETAAMRAEERERREAENRRMAREAAAMRAEERRRREAENRRMAEQKLQMDRERRGEEARRSIVEEKKRRESQNIADGQRKQRYDRHDRQDKYDRQDKHDRQRRERTKMADCVSCMEPGEVRDMAVLPCKHAYCDECIKGAFKSAYKSHNAFKCCGREVPLSSSISRHLSSSFVSKYDLLMLERSTPEPKYCSSPRCSAFLPPTSVRGSIGICRSCDTRTCILCSNPEHPGVCAADRDGEKLERLAKRKGWKQCPNCKQILERTEGCLHMTCRCGSEWCYACLREWGICGSSCGRGARAGAAIGAMGELVPLGEDMERQTRLVGAVPLVAAAFAMALLRR